MKIAVIAPGYAPVLGGVESVVTALAEGFAERGVEVEVWSHAVSAGADSHEIRSNVVVRRFRVIGSPRYPLSMSLMRYARAHAREFDLVHSHSYHSVAPLAGLLAPPQTPVVFSPHFHGGGHTAFARLLHRPYQPVGRRLFRRADQIIAVSDAERRLLEAHYPRLAGRCVVIPNAADVAAIHAAEPFIDQPPTVLVLGRLEAYKRVDTIIAAFAAADVPGQLVIAGDGPDRARLEGLARACLRGQDIRFIGRRPKPEIDSWLRTARCVVSMSQHEAFGIVGLEAVAAGARALLSDLPAHREVVELAGADMATVVDRATLTERLAAALNSTSAAPRAVRNWTSVVDEHLVLYERLLLGRAKNRQHC